MLVAQEVAEDKKKIAAFIDNVFLHGNRTAQVAMQLSKNIPECSANKYVYAASMIHDIGKVAMAILEPAYLDFLDMATKKELPRAVLQFAEEKRFGIDHGLLGALCCRYFRIFRPMERVVQFHHRPYILRSVNRATFQLCSLIHLASNVASNLKKVDKPDDPVVSVWRGPELKDFRIDIRQVMSVAGKVT